MSLKPILSSSPFRLLSFKVKLKEYYVLSQRRLSTRPSSIVAKTAPEEDATKIRNIGFIAHIDAGKTTTTERVLYYSGLNPFMGDVDKGDTVTDYLAQERERGITIISAATTFPWRRHKVNLLDTPGHVDFMIEVERCLNVLDSAIVILDSSSGVEAQTTTVWEQANRYNLPRIVYANKMDKANSDINLCLHSLAKLRCKPVLIHLPIYDGKRFAGLIDVTNLESYYWKTESTTEDGSKYQVEQLTSDHPKWKQALEQREKLVGSLCEFDESSDKLSEALLTCDDISKVPSSLVINSLRHCVIKNEIVPVLLGSSYKKIGVQPLMDAIVKYLPSPVERPNPVVKYYGDHFCGSAFKVVHHKIYGPLTFIRLYSGKLVSRSELYNINRNVKEKITKSYAPFADQFKEVAVTKFGNIVAVAGLTSTITGDTLTESQFIAEEAKKKFANANELPINECSPVLAGIKIPDPVFFCTIESPSLSKQLDLDKALANLSREDPTLTVTYDSNSGQTILSGMGELHLEVIRDRISQEYNIDAKLGPLRISYRECPQGTAEETISVNKIIGGANNYVTIGIRIKPSEDHNQKFRLKVVVTQDNDLGKLRIDKQKAIENGIEMALNSGPLMNFPVIGVDVDLLEFQCTRATQLSFISSITSEAVCKALLKTSIVLLEPIMKLEIAVPEKYYGKVITDLSSRRGQLLSEGHRHDYRLIEALAPLSELFSYATALRTFTSGTAILAMILDSYHKMTSNQQEKVLTKLRELW